ncbi:MAG TPA: exodeoxyribonuclease VII small subunit [Gemmataceae bacterium]|jgi:exodeoxyribonuclease VII small subunit|nr:exodeoxyribonuclease VII small subunit [Gemmataceae bacterium]
MSEPTPAEIPFEQALADLEQIVRDLEDGTTGLEESLAKYERGIGLLKQCYARLREAETRIVKLAGCDEDGAPLLEPFGHSAAVEAAEPKRKRESR